MIETVIDSLLRKLQRRNLLTPTVNLYCESVKAKFYQAQWSLDVLREIENAPNIQVSTTSQDAWNMMNINDKVLFFCECFWDFLRSSIDITAQLINELQQLGIDETEVTFYKVLDQMSLSSSTTLLFKALISCKKSLAFKELNSYRHCSTHRRQVCIFDRAVTDEETTLTRGYDYVGGSTTRIVNRYLCSNPSSLHPHRSLKRPVVGYNKKILETIEKRLSTIIGRLP